MNSTFNMTAPSSRNSPYGPIALRDEAWWQLGRRSAQRGYIGANGQVDQFGFDLELARTFRGLAEDLRRPTPDKEARLAHRIFFGAIDWAPMIGQYEFHGRQIFDLSSGLVHMLQHTDIRDCSLQNLQLPYPALYLHFGREAGLKTTGLNGESHYVDGALVAHAQPTGPQVLRFALTSIDESGNRITLPGHYLDLREHELQLPVECAIQSAVASFVNGGIDEPVPECPWAPAFWTEQRELASRVLLAAMPLIVNALFYLENPPRPHRTTLGAGTPVDVQHQWERTPSNRRRKLESTLNAEGFTLVHLVGEEISRSLTQGLGGTVTPHWRKGHWREQAHGPRLTLRKRVLIRPTLVNGHEVADPLQVKGHVYRAPRDPGPSPQP